MLHARIMKIKSLPPASQNADPRADADTSSTSQRLDATGGLQNLASTLDSGTGSKPPRADLPLEKVKLRDIGGVLTDEDSGKTSAFWIRLQGQPSGMGLQSPSNVTEGGDALFKASRQQANLLARTQGLVPHGWNLHTRPNPKSKRGKDKLVPERIYLRRDEMTVPGTNTSLPVRRNVLYEAAARSSIAVDSMPRELVAMMTSIPAGGTDGDAKPVEARLSEWGTARRIGEVLTFEVGDKYKAYVPHDIGENPVVLLSGHGLEANNRDVPMEPGVTYTYFGPSGDPIVGYAVRDVLSNHVYARHANLDGADVLEPVSDDAREAQASKLAGTARPLHMPAMSLTKYASLFDGAYGSKVSDLRDRETARELAFLAHDRNMIVATIRKGKDGSPNDFLAQLKAIGIQPSEIMIHACRADAKAVPDPQDPERSVLKDTGRGNDYFTDPAEREAKA